MFCFAGANQMKKNIGSMVDAFCLLNDPDAVLLLALKQVDCAIGNFQYQGEYELTDLVSHPNIYIVTQPLNDQAHADVFRMADFLLYPSQGESPGLQVSEAQLCGTIPICTNYTGLKEESCFPELLIRNFTLQRGQFNCYRAVVDARELKGYMEQAMDFWRTLSNPEHKMYLEAHARYDQFIQETQAKFQERTWANTAMELHRIFGCIANKAERIDLELTKL